MSRILKRKDVLSTAGDVQTLRIISNSGSLKFTINSKEPLKGWSLPEQIEEDTKNFRIYDKDWDIHIDIPATTVKSFLDSYKEGLWFR